MWLECIHFCTYLLSTISKSSPPCIWDFVFSLFLADLSSFKLLYTSYRENHISLRDPSHFN
uniref:Uncharacterized protein n=1 Tax=Rhizophora mucronata TaxID=61149 RepID=A0A2P2P6N7_RHIMU